MTPSSLFVDVGANLGSYTLLACAVRGARGVCFEPIPQTYEQLLANLRLNALMDRVEAFNLGIGAGPGTLTFVDDLDTMNHVVRPGEEADAQGVTVQVEALDTLLQGRAPSLIKIDVEGFETPVIEGALETLQKESLHSVVIELGGSGALYGYDEQVLFERLLSLGFRAYDYEPMTRQLRELDGASHSTDETHDNVLFIRDRARVEALLRETPTPKLMIHGVEL